MDRSTRPARRFTLNRCDLRTPWASRGARHFFLSSRPPGWQGAASAQAVSPLARAMRRPSTEWTQRHPTRRWPAIRSRGTMASWPTRSPTKESCTMRTQRSIPTRRTARRRIRDPTHRTAEARPPPPFALRVAAAWAPAAAAPASSTARSSEVARVAPRAFRAPSRLRRRPRSTSTAAQRAIAPSIAVRQARVEA